MLISLRMSILMLLLVLVGFAAAECPKGDLNGDCKVDFADMQALAAQWLYPPGSHADIDGLNGVEGRDLAALAGKWLKGGIPLVINEVMASNTRTIRDPQGQHYDDWIEIYNAGQYPIDVRGMHLTDDLNDPNKWQIPDDGRYPIVIGPGDYLLIWADNDTTASSGLHAAFELNADAGDEVGLYDVNGLYIDSVEFPDQTPDISYGRYPDGNDTWRFLGFASPKSPNRDAYLGQVADTKFSHNRGFYYAPFSALITTDTDGAEIYYTLDGSSPFDLNADVPTGTRYLNGVPITTTTCLRAVAVKDGWKHTNIDAQTYIFPDHVLQQATYPATGAQVTPSGYPTLWNDGRGDIVTGDYQIDPDIVGHSYPDDRLTASDLLAAPTISLVVDKEDYFALDGIYLNEALTYRVDQAPEKVASIEYIDPLSDESVQANCAIAMAGGASGGGTSLGRWKSYKLSMRPRFKTTTDYGIYTGGPSKLDFKLFPDSPVERFDTVVFDAVLNHSWLHPNGDQRTTVVYIQDQYMADLHNAMGGYSPHGFLGYLYLNGMHWGMYYFHERPDDTWAAEMFGGDSDEYDAFKHGTGDPDYIINNAIGNPIGVTAFTNYNAMLYAASAVQSDPTNLAKYDTLCEALDVDNFITYLIVNWYGGNTDWPHKNWYATCRTHHPDGRWRFHSWDAEHAIDKTINAGDINNKIGSSPSGIHARLDGNAEYLIRFADILHKNFYNDGAMTPSNTAKMYVARMTTVDRAIVGESARWGDNRSPSNPYTRSDWQAVQEDKLNTFFPQRSDDVLNILKGRGLYPSIAAPVFRINDSYQHGGHISSTDSLSMTATAGTIYYTIDSNDPRLPGGAVDTDHAIAYSGDITLGHSTHVKARLKNGGTWSALNEATYAVGPLAQNLRITEIMYHPQYTGDPNDPNEEFIELRNTSNIVDDVINLSLVRFTDGIDFTFGDIELGGGDNVVVVKDEAAFLKRYQGFSGVIAGEYSGRLNNAGERIELQDALGETIQSFEYKDGWRSITDGGGFSLTVLQPSDSTVYRPDLGLVAHWKLDDASGTTAIDSAGGNDGTLYGEAAWTDGRIDGALSFDGDGDYVSLPGLDVLVGVNVTLEAWICLGSSGGVNDPIVMQHTATNEGYRFNVVEDKPTFAIIYHGRGVKIIVSSPDTISKGQWYHVAGTNDGANLKIYVDGEFKGSVSSVGYTGVMHDAYIGYDHTLRRYWNGLIDDVRIYNRTLGAHEFEGIGNPLDRWDAKDSWRASAFPGGSPGWDDSGIIPDPDAVVINEIMAHSHSEAPDWIELYNATNKQINIGGWYLSDSAMDPRKYRFAAGTKIDPYDHLVLVEDANFGKDSSDPGKITGFAFSENGDEAYLRSADADVLTGYRAVEGFGASYTGIAFGRYFKNSTGNYNFVPMAYDTPDERNAYPAVGPIVINEIMYNPDWPIGGTYGNDRYEYIELLNITSWPVKLWRDDKALPWKFTDGIDFVFDEWPNEVTIAPGASIVVVRDPNAFTERYPSVPVDKIFGPYEGQLSNGGERLELSMPGDIDKYGRRHYIRIDRVTYSDGAHSQDVPGGVDLWTTEADGGGMSLNRVAPELYGNDPNNWTAAETSPGN